MEIIKNIQADSAQALAVPTSLLDLTVEQVIAPADEIVAAAQAGSSAAFEELHSIYSRRLYQTIFSLEKCTLTSALEFGHYCTAYSRGSFFNPTTLESAPIPSAGISLRLSALDRDTAITIAPANSANGNTGKITARKFDKKDWPPRLNFEISNLLQPVFPIRASF